jgi:hypothetical protein
MDDQRMIKAAAAGAVLALALLWGCSDDNNSASRPHQKVGSGGASVGSGGSSAANAGKGSGGTDTFGNATTAGTGTTMREPTMPIAGSDGPCVEGMADTSPVTPTVWLIVDGSSSMNSMFDNANDRWHALRSTLMDPGGIVDSLQAVVRFGMVIYSGGGAGGFGGATGGACPMLVTIQPALNNFAAIDAMYPQQPLGAGTPTDKALDNVVMNLPVLNQAMLDKRVDPIYVVLATDGAPNDLCSGGGAGNVGQEGDPVVMQRVIDVVTRGTMMGMQMFVISLAGSDMALQTHLQNVANATSSKIPPFMPSTKADLINNFQSIVGGATCQVTLNGTVAAGQECTGKVVLNGMTLACNSDNGWRMPDDHTVQLTGTACDTLLGAQSLVSATFPCGVFMVH